MRYAWKHSGTLGAPIIVLTDAGGPHTLSASVAPTLGGNIVSLLYDGIELLHRGGDLSPEPRGGWDGKAPLLWPAVGRQRYGAYAWPPGSSGRHAMPIHGFAKDASFIVVSAHASDSGGVKLCLRLHWRDAAEHAVAFPFEYRLDIEYSIYQNVLTVQHMVENCAVAGELPFAVGNHLSLRFPFCGPAHAGWQAGSITASTTVQHELDAGSLLSGRTADRSRELGGSASRGGGMHLDAPGATDGVFGLPAAPVTQAAAAASRTCWMALSQPGALSVRVSHELRKPSRRVGVAAPGGPWNEAAWAAAQDRRFFVLWGEPPPPPPPGGLAPLVEGAPGFVCVEPWQSGPDSLNTGDGLVVLGPAQRAEWVFRVEVSGAGAMFWAVSLALSALLSSAEQRDPLQTLRRTVAVDGSGADEAPPHRCALAPLNGSVLEALDCYPFDVASPEACWARGCCWRPVASGPWCVPAAAPAPELLLCRSVPLPLRVDCHPEPGASPDSCAARGCCWTPLAEPDRGSNAPWCHHPTPVGYVVGAVAAGGIAGGFSAHLVQPPGRAERGAFGQAPRALAASAEVFGSSSASSTVRVRVSDASGSVLPRWAFPPALGIPAATTTSGHEPVGGEEGVAPSVLLSKLGEPFSARITRRGGSGSVGGSGLAVVVTGPLVFEPQLVQVSFALPPGSVVHGLGQAVAPWSLPVHPRWGRVHTIWTRDRGTPEAGFVGNANLYGAHPFALAVSPADGSAVGVFLLSTAPLEAVLHDADASEEAAAAWAGDAPPRVLTFQAAGGSIDAFVFLGPSPSDVIEQYHAVIGRPALPPRWALGFHVCRWGYGSVDAARAVSDALVAARFPFDASWLDIDYMHRYRVFTTGESFSADRLRAWVDDLHAAGRRFVFINDPGIFAGAAPGEYAPYDSGVAGSVFIRTANNATEARGDVWPGTTVFADFGRAAAHEWWRRLVTDFHAAIGFDGLWLDMGEPSVFRDAAAEAAARRSAAAPSPFPPPPDVVSAASAGGGPSEGSGAASSVDWTFPPFLPGRRGGAAILEDKTLPTSSQTALGPEYFLHSLFGFLEARATAPVLRDITGQRQFIISRSTFAGSGAHGGAWLGDNWASWRDLRASLSGVLTAGIFGVPLIGADVCGFAGEATAGGSTGIGVAGSAGLDVELCVRWYQAGAIAYTFYRTHTMAGRPDQHPAAFVEEPALRAMRDAAALRYSLVPYYYTLLAAAARTGGTVIRALSFEFLEAAVAAEASVAAVTELLEIDEQVMVGPALLATPVLRPNATLVSALLPPWGTRWYDWRTGAEASETGWVSLPAPLLAGVPLHIRGGWIVPSTMPPAGGFTTTAAAATLPLMLTIALPSPQSGALMTARGSMYTDDGGSVNSSFIAAEFLATVDVSGSGKLLVMAALQNAAQGGEIKWTPCIAAVRVLGVVTASGLRVSSKPERPLPCEAAIDSSGSRAGGTEPTVVLECTFEGITGRQGVLILRVRSNKDIISSPDDAPSCIPVLGASAMGLSVTWRVG